LACTQQRVTLLQGERMMGRDDARSGAGTEEGGESGGGRGREKGK